MWSNYREDGAGDEENPKRRKPKKTALVSAVDILARQEYSTRKLTEKLRRKGYEDEEIVSAVERLEEKHYLNDEDACQRQFDFLYNESRNSVRQIEVKLMQRGFAADLVKRCVPEDIWEREKAACLKVLRLQFHADGDTQKMAASLYRRGFDTSALRAAIDDYTADAEE